MLSSPALTLRDKQQCVLEHRISRMNRISRRDFILRGALLSTTAGLASSALIARAAGSNTPANVQPRYNSFRPGEPWLDTAGKPIQAHAGSMIAVGDTYYWYGENKEFTDGKSGIESWGIRFYASKDLYNWEDLGPLIPPDEDDPDSPLSPAVFPERPHILFNE